MADFDINAYLKEKTEAITKPAENEMVPGKTFAEKMKEKREEAYAVADKTYPIIWSSPSEYETVLGIMERFSRNNGTKGGGAVNAVLIYAAQKDATYLLNFNEWNRLGNYIKKGETHISLFSKVTSHGKTYLNVEDFFDISQVTVTKHSQKVEIEQPPVDLDLLIDALAGNDKYSIEYDSAMPDGYDSLYVGQGNLILLREGTTPEHQVFHILQELGHRIFSREQGYQRTPVNEFAAYSSAYILARRYGLDVKVPFRSESFPETVQTPGQIKEFLSSVYYVYREVAKDVDKQIDRLQEKPEPENNPEVEV